jgi:hypothetical protein
MKRRGHP